MTKKEAIIEIIKKLMYANNIRSLEELGEALGVSSETARQTKYAKAKRKLNNLDHESLLMFAGLFGVPYELLKNGDERVLNYGNSVAVGNSVNIGGTGNIVGQNNIQNPAKSSSELSASEFVSLDDQQRADYLEFLKLIKDK